MSNENKVTSKDYIKHMKPRKNSKYHQGMIDPKKLSKYYDGCKNEPVIFRSGLELDFINYCENNPSIVKWASEAIKIPYFSRLDNRMAEYYPDYIIENAKGTRCIVEVKPANQTVKPDMCDTAWLKESWIKNVDKWKAAKKFADEHGMKFILVTEKFFQ